MKNIKKTAIISIAILLLLGTSILAACETELLPLEVPYDLSSYEYVFEKEYFFDDYNDRHSSASYGIDVFEKETKEVVFESLTYERLVGLLESEGSYLILLGGSWCHNTRAEAELINKYALENDIHTIYNFDFRLDGTNSSSHVRETNNASSKNAGVQFNYLYGELVSRYLTNLTDWVEYSNGSKSSANYTNASGEVVNVAKVQVPFLFLYNKDNTVRNVPTRSEDLVAWHNQTGIHTEDGEQGKTYPIVYGFEEMVDRDEGGIYYSVNRVKTYDTEAFSQRIKGVFDYITKEKIQLSTYSNADYIREFYNKKSGKTIFEKDDQINIHTITYRQLIWLLEEEGNVLILFGGSWCPNTQAVIATINDYAVANNLIIYNFDTKLDSGYANANWGYEKDAHIRDSANPFVKLYTDLVETYLPNIETLYDKNSSQAYQYISYATNGEEVRVNKLQVPYLLAYNKDAKADNGVEPAPITAYYEEMLTISDSAAADYVYASDNYARYKAGVYKVIQTYFDREESGIVAREITVDRAK